MKAARPKKPSTAQAAREVRILDETKRLMSEVGADRMTVRDLAAASGVAPGTIYNRFGGKDQVISMAVLDHFEKAIRSRLDDNSDVEKTPLDKLLDGLKLIARDCIQGPALARALMSAYFKLGTERRMLDSLYQALYATWLPVIEDMQRRNQLRPWVLAPALCVELCDREFGAVMKWAQNDIPFAELRQRSVFSVLSILLGASQGEQAQQIERLLQQTLAKTAKSYT